MITPDEAKVAAKERDKEAYTAFEAKVEKTIREKFGCPGPVVVDATGVPDQVRLSVQRACQDCGWVVTMHDDHQGVSLAFEVPEQVEARRKALEL